jgi:hypothetical protein
MHMTTDSPKPCKGQMKKNAYGYRQVSFFVLFESSLSRVPRDGYRQVSCTVPLCFEHLSNEWEVS